MPVLYEPANPELYRKVKDRNLEQQYILLRTTVDYALSVNGFRYSRDTMLALHSAASTFLDETPGRFRTDDVHINGSQHIPPGFDQLETYVDDFFAYLNAARASRDPFHLAAFALWRLTWIHPFGECNGRTARALSYMIICIEHGAWLPGEETVLSLMSETKNEGYGLLAAADRMHAETGGFTLTELEIYLKKLTITQLEGIGGT